MSVVNKREFAGSGLTMAAHRGADFVGADKVGERIAATVAAGAHEPSLTYLYDGDLDWTGHRYGVASSEWLQQLAMIDHEAEQLREALPPATRLVVVADHGMVDSPPESRVDVDTVHELRDGLVLFGGEARFRQLYCQRGAVDDVVATWRSVLGDKAEVLTREEATAHGWFGAVDLDGAAPDRRRRGGLPRRRRGDLQRRLGLRGPPRGHARLADARRDADPGPGRLRPAVGRGCRRRRPHRAGFLMTREVQP